MRLNQDVIEFFACRGCRRSHCSTVTTFSLLAEHLPAPSTGADSVNLLCEACNLLSAYSRATIGTARYSHDRLPPKAQPLIDAVFEIQIPCGELSCGEIVVATALATTSYTQKWQAHYLETAAKLDGTVACNRGDVLGLPIEGCTVRRLYPAPTKEDLYEA